MLLPASPRNEGNLADRSGCNANGQAQNARARLSTHPCPTVAAELGGAILEFATAAAAEVNVVRRGSCASVGDLESWR